MLLLRCAELHLREIAHIVGACRPAAVLDEVGAHHAVTAVTRRRIPQTAAPPQPIRPGRDDLKALRAEVSRRSGSWHGRVTGCCRRLVIGCQALRRREVAVTRYIKRVIHERGAIRYSPQQRSVSVVSVVRLVTAEVGVRYGISGV